MHTVLAMRTGGSAASSAMVAAGHVVAPPLPPLLLLLLRGLSLQTITEAYHVLRDSKKRQQYDAGQYRA
jgi:hypothetical protein